LWPWYLLLKYFIIHNHNKVIVIRLYLIRKVGAIAENFLFYVAGFHSIWPLSIRTNSHNSLKSNVVANKRTCCMLIFFASQCSFSLHLNVRFLCSQRLVFCEPRCSVGHMLMVFLRRWQLSVHCHVKIGVSNAFCLYRRNLLLAARWCAVMPALFCVYDAKLCLFLAKDNGCIESQQKNVWKCQWYIYIFFLYSIVGLWRICSVCCEFSFLCVRTWKWCAVD